MKKQCIYFISIVVLMLGIVSCEKDFSEINTDPNTISDPDLRYLFTHSINKMGDYKYTEWFYDNYQYIYRFTQQTVGISGNSSDFTIIGATGGRSGSWYTDIMPNLFEIRYQIDDKTEEEREAYEFMYATSYIPQVMQGIRVTDIYGSRPYSEAMEGRYDSNFSPVYDNQKFLFEQWLGELDLAIETLTSGKQNQVEFGDQDFIFRGDWSKWAKLANSLRLRIAVRVENADPAWAQEIISKAVNSSAGFITEEDDQMIWEPSLTYGSSAGDFNTSPCAAKNYMDFLRDNRDPRTRFFFERNEFDQATVDSFLVNDKNIPSFVNEVVREPWDRYQGAPVSPDENGDTDYFSDFKYNTTSIYRQLSYINRRFMANKYDSWTDGVYDDVLFSAAEGCLYIAEMIEKGYITSMGSAEDWYYKGVRLSIETYDWQADRAIIKDYDELKLADGEIDQLLEQPAYEFSGNTLEKIYVQQYINFFRLPTECYTLTRRTGYPKKNSEILAWEPVLNVGAEMMMPRRFPWNDTTDETNKENYYNSIEEQGFTLGSNDPDVLNQERLWYDKNSPNFGEGN
ncbi:SusD/RagB family nutrient-binding outer membrane lipoprotein [Puteibacter caeruleilacunae]|nr:SusD/RagB family nutrient-binding outer membrane lipoprotein [Puteibacter caeruleilacunae]